MSREPGTPGALTLDKRSKIMLGVLAVVLVVAGAWFLLKPGSSGNSNAAKAPVAMTPHASVTPTTTPTSSPTPSVPAIGYSTRDPFTPLAQEVVATSSASATATSTTSTAATVTATPSASTSAATTAHSITLVSINNGSADLTVDGTDKTVKAGDSVITGISCIKVTADSIFITFDSKAYAIAPGQTVSV